MKLLNVIDLDRTLLTIDSFRYVVLRNLNLYLGVIIVLRLLKIISRAKFAEKASVRICRILFDEKKLDDFIQDLLGKINTDVLKKIQQLNTADAVIVIVSASPQCYVEKFAERLGFVGLSSHWRGKIFFYCYGENKVKLLEENYPPSEYKYNFAISDSDDDINLLNLFETAFLIKNGKFIALQKTD